MMKLMILFVVLSTFVTLCLADETEDAAAENPEKPIAKDTFKDPTMGLTNFFKETADTMKEGSNSASGMFQDWSGGMFKNLGNAKDKVKEHGQKIKSTLEGSASNVKGEVESAASNVSYHGQKAMDFMKSFINRK